MFAHCHTVEDIKKEYRRLAMLHHPDRGGSTAKMQEINAAYHAALQRANGQRATDPDGHEHTYTYNREREQTVMDKIAEILQIRGAFDVLLIGTWVWIIGDTKPIKEQLKALGCVWHSKRLCWYWRPADSRHYGKSSPHGFDALAARYGAEHFHRDDTDRGVSRA